MSVAATTSFPVYEDISTEKKEQFNFDQNSCYGVVKKNQPHKDVLPVSDRPSFGRLNKCTIVLMVVMSLVLIVSTVLAVTTFIESSEVKKELVTLQEELRQVVQEVQEVRNLMNVSSEMTTPDCTQLSNWRGDISKHKANTSNASFQEETDALVSDIQSLYVFDSCATIMNLCLPFTSGMYWLRSSNGSAVQVYCSMDFSCNGTTGGWRRVAYLNTSGSDPVRCPNSLEVRSDPNSCIRSEYLPGCSSVNYHSYGISYSQICGRVHAHRFGSLDGFQNFGYDRNNATLEGNYVDGVSLTYGRSPRSHIWTFAASININSDGCLVCDRERPGYIGREYSCELLPRCTSYDPSPSHLWDEYQCVGGSVFYRQLTQHTTDDIEMRVCRDQERGGEDVLLTFVDIYVQ